MGRRLFCEISPTCYKISTLKEKLKRNLSDALKREVIIAGDKSEERLPEIIKSHSSILVRKLYGVDPVLQQNKVTNIGLACDKINGIIVHPGETFSFWRTIGSTSARKGYKEGLVISRNGLSSGIGGGLCQMANMIHWLVLHSDLTVTELHHHSDALFPDERRRVPFGTGTSVSNNYIDYRFKNNTENDVQILVWIEGEELCGELRSTIKPSNRYKLIEENDHFQKEGDCFYRVSQVYRVTIDRETNRETARELVLDNHSKVMYDYSLIPADKISNEDTGTN